MRGSLSGRQDIEYDQTDAYSIPDGEKVTADAYSPIFVAKVTREGRVKFYQVRTKTSVNMTAAYRLNIALLGGAGALYAALLRQKASAIYNDCVRVCPKNMTLRAFLMPIMREALAGKESSIEIAQGVEIVNPWVSQETPNVPVPSAIVDKFASVLSV